MFLAVAIGNAPDLKYDLQWWYRQQPHCGPAELRERLEAAEPCILFDPHSAADPAAERERLYDFLHSAAQHHQAIVVYASAPGAELPPLGANTLEPIPAQYALNSLRAFEIIEYQVAHHDDEDGAAYDPEGYADELAEKRAARWQQNRTP